MGGLFVAIFLTLLYLPGLSSLWFRKSLKESGQASMPILRYSIQSMRPTHFRLLRRQNTLNTD